MSRWEIFMVVLLNPLSIVLFFGGLVNWLNRSPRTKPNNPHDDYDDC